MKELLIAYYLFTYTRFGLESNYVDNKVGRATEILWLRTYAAGSIPDGVNKVLLLSGNNVLDFE